MRLISFITFIILYGFTSNIYAIDYTVESIPNSHLSNKTEFTSNPDTILSAAEVYELNQLLYQIEQKTTAEVAVVAVKSIGDEELRPFATALFQHWGIGKRQKDNGLLILFVLNKRQVTFETGYGLEGLLPDGICKRIQMDNMIPYFKEAKYGEGLIMGVKAIEQRLTTPEAIAEIKADKPVEKESDFIYYYLIVSILISTLMLVLILLSTLKIDKTDNYAKYKTLKSYKNTLTLFAFIFPLYAAFIYIWLSRRLKSLRNKPQKCDVCNKIMRKLDEEEDNKYLTPEENTEEKLASVDYDVWLCEECGNTKIFRYDSTFTSYSECPQCHTKAYSLSSDRIVSAPTPISSGMGEKKYTCKHCKYQNIKQYIIPMIIVVPTNRRGGSGFGGGGFSGGSFGGGRSGGGGATSGW